ncbi:MAG: LamG-like jellyroll fold domain-containing protein, partial [Lentisphaerota bacterium]
EIKPGVWQHFVFTWDGKTSTIFVDGKQVAQKKLGGQVQLGTETLDLFLEYKGLARFLRLYNKALSPDEVQQIFEVETPR